MKMRRVAAAALVAAAVIGVQTVRADRDHNRVVVLRATMVGANEVPPISTPASGSFRATISADDTITFRLTYRDLTDNITQSHIHFAQKNVAGGIMIFLCGPPSATDPTAWPLCPGGKSGVLEGTITERNVVAIVNQGIAAGDLAAALRAIADDEGYANVHSVRFPGGEIRGQVDVQGRFDATDKDD
jgi:hypothetical protein